MMNEGFRTHPWYTAPAFLGTGLLLGLILSLAAVSVALAAGNIDPTNKWAWSANAGWINFAPDNGGVTIFSDHLEGDAWGENIGWIRLGTYTGGGSHTYANDAAGAYGVNNDGAGNLSGYAWGANVGWINFDPDGAERVTIDPATGDFNGYAWGENVGWIHFRNASPAYKVNTAWRPTSPPGGSIDASNKWAWGANAGWISFAPDNGGVTVFSDHLEGDAWGENIGWIRLGTCTSGSPCTYDNDAASTYGVNNDGAGNLSGFAWSANVGWINFDPDGAERVTIDPVTGDFEGHAWGENVGWIKFKGTGVVAYGVSLQPAVAPTVSLNASGGNLVLDWSAAAANGGGYEVCWSATNPFFAPSAPCAPAAGTSYIISPAPSANTYYAVRGINGVGQKSGLSNRVGVVHFTIVPGT